MASSGCPTVGTLRLLSFAPKALSGVRRARFTCQSRDGARKQFNALWRLSESVVELFVVVVVDVSCGVDDLPLPGGNNPVCDGYDLVVIRAFLSEPGREHMSDIMREEVGDGGQVPERHFGRSAHPLEHGRVSRVSKLLSQLSRG